MASTSPGSEVPLKEALEDLTTALKAILLQLKAQNEGVDTVGVKGCGAAIGLYRDCFKKIAVSNRAEVENEARKFYKHNIVRESFDELLQVEDEWNTCLKTLDNSRSSLEKCLDVGDCLSQEIKLLQVSCEGLSEVLLSEISKERSLLVVLLRHYA